MYVIHDISPYKLNLDGKVRDAARIIQLTRIKIALICDHNDCLVGTITDGDIRRGVLHSFDADAKVTEVMNSKPQVLKQNEIDVDSVYFKMQNLVIKHMPVIDNSGKVVKLYFYDEFEEPLTLNNPILLMAGGYGKRLRPLTDNIPKPLLEVGNKPVILHLLEHFQKQGFWKFYISINYLGDMIKEYLGNGSKYGVVIEYLTEDKPLGTAGCLSMLSGISKPILVMNSDLITKENFCRALTCFEETNVIASVGVRDYIHTVPFGCIEVANKRVIGIEEKPTSRYLINAGVYILSPYVLKYVPKNSFINMPDLLQTLVEDNKPVGIFRMHEDWVDIGHKEDLSKTRRMFEKEGVAIDS